VPVCEYRRPSEPRLAGNSLVDVSLIKSTMNSVKQVNCSTHQDLSANNQGSFPKKITLGTPSSIAEGAMVGRGFCPSPEKKFRFGS